MNYSDIKRQAALEAEQMHEEWLLEHFSGAPLSDAELAQEDTNEEADLDYIREALITGSTTPDELKDLLAAMLFYHKRRRTFDEWRSQELLEQSAIRLPAEASLHQPTRGGGSRKKTGTFMEKFDEYLGDQKARFPNRTDATVKEYRDAIEELRFVLGDTEIAKVEHEDARRYRDTIKQFPKHRNKGRFKSLTADELTALELPESETLKAKTVNDRLAKLSSYFKWLGQNGYTDINPFEGLSLKAETQSYQAYSIEDLSEIFSSSLYRYDEKWAQRWGKKSHWWLILLGLFTGARVGELAQLTVSDIRRTGEGIWFISINDEEESGKRVKTSAGVREVPIHPQLIELGFTEYVEELRNTGSKSSRLLPGIRKGIRKPGDQASKWYNEGYRDKGHLPERFQKERKVFHSFRHTFIQEAIRNDADIAKLQQMVGHEQAVLKETKTYSGRGFTVESLNQEIIKVEYTGLNLRHLKGGYEKLPKP
ncbi:site-specific tyrosine recombinase XerC [Microbulbifer aggregans]|uniref:Site-specific tyrosine recombinase XerC n=1 Tax=Microbulbifer aggregans TaxID=1769779 RepID=A0A1C9W4Q7_9GAMM|nr:site-specific integrase [Microbulbifer aggregans]AOS96132.1 site-specific tyrosine recombinase XerC [Microbulbifer aggregans]